MLDTQNKVLGESSANDQTLRLFYNKQEVYDATLEYFKGDDLATNVWVDKYCLKNAKGEFLELTPDDMHKRLATEFARIEQKYPNPLSYEQIYTLLCNFSYIIPGGSILYGVGNGYSISSLGNCFVIGNTSDSYGGICTTDQEQAQLMKRRAGVGHDLSHLRPAKTIVSNAAGTSTGAVSFLSRYSNTTREVAQDGRRGALMLSMDINHPDSEQFITSKEDLTKITGANISVKITDDFMIDVCENTMSNNSQLWNKLAHQAWKSAEPGVLYWDKIKSESIPSCYGKEWEETSTNPCGEIPLCPYDSCRLLSVNLYSMVDNPFTSRATFNYEKFKKVVKIAQRLMDDIVDLEEEKINLILKKIETDPEPEEIKAVEKNLWLKIRDKLLLGRRTGLSAIGLADIFASLTISYGSDSSISLAEEIYKQFAIAAYSSSIDIAKERGAFPIWNIEKEKENSFLHRIFEYNPKDPRGKLNKFTLDYFNYGRRNIACLTIPPSGTISLLAGISSGIEPVYQLYYKRRRKLEKGNPNITFVDQNGDGWEEYTVLHPKFKTWMKRHIHPEDWEVETTVGLEEHIKHSPWSNATAYEIDPIQRVKLQAAIQKWIDHSISSTINLPESTTESEISDIYMTAWKKGCKGITIYRDNSRTGVLISANKTDAEDFKQHNAPKRPRSLDAKVSVIKVKGETYTIFVGLLNEKPYEVFALGGDHLDHSVTNPTITKIGSGNYLYGDNPIQGLMSDEEQTITRLISTALRHGAEIKFIVEQLNKTEGDLTSFSKAIARVLKHYIQDETDTREICPDCGSKMIYKDGCKQCSQCVYSKCN